MRHRFLIEEGIWASVGNFYDQQGQVVPCTGETRIVHHNALWILDSVIRVVTDQPLEFANHYEITPPQPGTLEAKWTSKNPAMGELFGQFTFIEDTILSHFRCKKGKHRGIESFVCMDGVNYLNRGAMFFKEQRTTSWAMQLKEK